MKGELIKHSTDPILLNGLCSFDSEKSDEVTNQKVRRVKAIAVRLTENIVDERMFSYPRAEYIS